MAKAKAPAHAEEILDEAVKEYLKHVEKWGYKLTDGPAGKALIAQNHEVQVEMLRLVLDRDRECVRAINQVRAEQEKTGQTNHFDAAWRKIWHPHRTHSDILAAVLRKKLPLAEADVLALLEWVGSIEEGISAYIHPLGAIVTAVENLLGETEPAGKLKTALEKYEAQLRKREGDRDVRLVANRVQKLLSGSASVLIQPGEAWSDQFLEDRKAWKAKPAEAWNALLAHCQEGGAAKFTANWRKKAEPLLKAVGFEPFKQRVLEWFPLVDKPRTAPIERRHQYEPDQNNLILDPHVELLRGLVWCCGFREDADLARAVMRLALSAYRKVPGKGPRLVSLGNACVTSLGMMPGLPPIGQLAVLKVKVKFGTAQKEIEKAFLAAAEREELPREEIEELAVPTYGLTEVGKLEDTFGEYTATIQVDGSDATLTWSKAGKTLKSIPAAARAEHAEDIKELQAALKDLKAMLPAQRERLDSMFLLQKSWPLGQWKERYLDHPLIGTIARRLIWTFADGKKAHSGVWHNGEVRGLDGKPLKLSEDANVSLWHPIDHPESEIVAWRDWLAARQIVQPFKQAHREVYLLTDAERRTRTYSNRFAAHVLRQHQYHALAQGRGWKNKLRLMVDDTYPPTSRELPQWNLRAEYWVEGAGTEYGTDTNDSGAYLRLITDQVRFYDITASQVSAHAGGGGYSTGRTSSEPIPLENVPALVLSEVFRDVDLFVGVASVGNDPNWSDGGPGGRHRDYWQSYSFGELSASAATRKAILAGLIPRLKIAPQCTLEERFLKVRGKLRTYRIHLGSGNILMDPNDQYLCIVPKQSGTVKESLFLPFEGDNVLSIILSKAFLLAADDRITDTTITSQINRKA